MTAAAVLPALRPWQEANVADALAVPPGTRRLYVAPTGTGKGTAMLAVLAGLRERGVSALLTTPSGEIARGLLDRLGLTEPGAEVGEAALWRAAEAAGIYSPVRLRNRLRSGRIAPPAVLLYDEGHHGQEASVVAAEMLALAPGASWLGWTATPYRGTHRGTEALREWWGEPQVLLSIAEAAAARYLSVPSPAVWPLLDDAGARVAAGGEYDAEDLERLTNEQRALARLAERIAAAGWVASGAWDRPTLVAVASVALAHEAAGILSAAGMPAAAVSGETPRAERDALLARCGAREVALVQVQVLAEGVDMPWLRRLVDLRPLRSPVAWLQLLGRITRPVAGSEAAPEYVAGCRNAERHGYLLAGQWPARRLAQETQAAMGGGSGGGGPLERGVAKDALKGRQVVRVPLLGGGAADVVHLESISSWEVIDEVLAVGVPGEEWPRAYRREIRWANGARDWGRWRVADLDPEGYAGWSRPAPAKALSEKQASWWRTAAAGKGLDPAGKITKREFAVLPALADSGQTLLPRDGAGVAMRLAAVREVGASSSGVGDSSSPTTLSIRCAIGSSPRPGEFPVASEKPAGDRRNGRHGAEVVRGDATDRIFRGPDPEHAAVAAVEAEEQEAAEKSLLAEVERRAAGLSETLRALEEGEPLPATWARLRDGGWGARVSGEAATAVVVGRDLRLRTKDGREGAREVTRVVLRGEGWCLAEIRESVSVVGLPEGRYAIADAGGALRFLVVDGRGRLYEQAGAEFHVVASARAAALATLVRVAGFAEAAARYGRELGICGVCGRALTDATSRLRGMGESCAAGLDVSGRDGR